MPLPPLILAQVKDKLRLPVSIATYDAIIGQQYETILKELLLDSDFFIETVPLPSVADQSIYPLSARAVRLLALFYNRVSLLRVPSRTNDLLTEWEVEPSGTPQTFTMDALPVNLDSPTVAAPDQFLVRPAPAAVTSGDRGFMAWEAVVPADLSAPMILPYLVPYLTYATAARVLEQDLEIRDLPASQFWAKMANLWRTVCMATVKL